MGVTTAPAKKARIRPETANLTEPVSKLPLHHPIPDPIPFNISCKLHRITTVACATITTGGTGRAFSNGIANFKHAVLVL